MITLSASAPWVTFTVLTLLWMIVRKHWNGVKLLLTAAVLLWICDTLCAWVLKPWIGRLRPCHQFEWIELLTYGCGGRFSFPSNHAANGATVAFFFVWMLRTRWKWVLLALTSMTAFSRVYLGVHFPSDVIVGTLVGFAIGGCGAWFYKTRLKKSRRLPA